MASFGKHRLVPQPDCGMLDKVRHQNDKAKGIVKQSSDAKSTGNIGKLTAFRRPSNPSMTGRDLVQKRTKDILNSTRLIHAAKEPFADQLPEKRTISLVSRDRRKSDVTFVQKKKNLAGKRASVGVFTGSDLMPNSCGAFAGVSGKLASTVNKKKFTKTCELEEEHVDPDASKVCDRTFVKEFHFHEQNLRLDSLSKRQTSNPDYYKTYYGDTLHPTSSSCFGVNHDLQSSSNVFPTNFSQTATWNQTEKQVSALPNEMGIIPYRRRVSRRCSELFEHPNDCKRDEEFTSEIRNLELNLEPISSQSKCRSASRGSVTSISSAEKDFTKDVTDLFTSTPRSLNKNCLTIPAFQKARIQENEDINEGTKDVLVSEINPASSFPVVEIAENNSYSEAGCEVVLGSDGNQKGIFEKSQKTDNSQQLKHLQHDASIETLTAATVCCGDEVVDGNDDEFFNELEFEVFENEDLGMKPKRKGVKSSEDLSIIDLDSLKPSDLTLLPAFKSVYSAHVGPTQKLDPQSHSGAFCLKLQKSYSSPENFTDLSLALLPDFDVDFMQWEEDAAAAAFHRNSCGEFPLQWSSMSRSDATSNLCSVSSKKNSALEKPSGNARPFCLCFILAVFYVLFDDFIFCQILAGVGHCDDNKDKYFVYKNNLCDGSDD